MPPSLTDLARAGFTDLETASGELVRWCEFSGVAPSEAIAGFAVVADPDQAVKFGNELYSRHRPILPAWMTEAPGGKLAAPLAVLLRVLGASAGLAEFLLRNPEHVDVLGDQLRLPLDGALVTRQLRDAASAELATDRGVMSEAQFESGSAAIRRVYRRWLLAVAAVDVSADDALEIQPEISRALSALAAAALEAALALSREFHSTDEPHPGRFARAEVAATRLAVVGMGKAGAEELNYVSDVDVIYAAESADRQLVTVEHALAIATALARSLQHVLAAPGVEPGLWEVDANLRPEGKDGALVRTLDSHVSYYERWAKNWEFQALLKARPLAGDAELGAQYLAALTPMVWASSAEKNFVESVQRMRERVTANIPPAEVDIQLKLGPGGLRDIEFTVQLLQLVHGRTDTSVRTAGTQPALAALAAGGYIGRVEAAGFADDYRFLRVLEHRMQLRRLRRTHLMPRSTDELRILARASALAPGAEALLDRWQEVRNRVRGLHERLFYRPLLATVARAPGGEFILSGDQAEDRLRAIGFRDARGAMASLGSLTAGVSRRAAIHRALLPAVLTWIVEGADPDFGLLTYRRLSEALGETPWYLRMLRDSHLAAQRLCRIVSSSRYVSDLLQHAPELTAWLEDDTELRPRTARDLAQETRAVIERYQGDSDMAATVLRSIRRRELLRLAIAGILDTATMAEIATGLTDLTENHIRGLLEVIRGAKPDGIEFSVIAMGRFGGGELGFGSDVDVLYVYRVATEPAGATERALHIVSELRRLSEDNLVPFDLDAGLRPEGKNGVVARSLDAYRAYYERWSLTWEAQALLRARPIAGDELLGADFTALADTVRYPAVLDVGAVREVRRIKARVESERLPQGVDPARHLKLGRGSLSDVEWYVQLLQLQYGNKLGGLRTSSTLRALSAAQEHGLVDPQDSAQLRDAWVLASRVRSALVIWQNRISDVLPSDRDELEGVARLLGYPAGSASRLEEDYLAVTRRARSVFERGFYG